jgi:tetratricopeptide (TPR) repeat protein
MKAEGERLMSAEGLEALNQRARKALGAGDAKLAKQCYMQMLAEDPDSADAHYGLATGCFLLKDLEGAAYHFKEVIRLDPLRAGAYTNLGAVYHRLGNLDEALKALRKGIQLDRTRAESYYNLGMVLRKLGQAEAAIQAYREAVQLNPQMADGHFNLANILVDIGRYAQAIHHYQQALEIDPNFDKADSGLRNAEAALRHEEGIVEKGEGSPDSSKLRAVAAGDLGRTLDPIADGVVLTQLHQATINAQSQGKDFLSLLEPELETAIKELSLSLLYPNKSAKELKERLQRVETAMQAVRVMQKTMQTTMKRVMELSEQLLTAGVK